MERNLKIQIALIVTWIFVILSVYTALQTGTGALYVVCIFLVIQSLNTIIGTKLIRQDQLDGMA